MKNYKKIVEHLKSESKEKSNFYRWLDESSYNSMSVTQMLNDLLHLTPPPRAIDGMRQTNLTTDEKINIVLAAFKKISPTLEERARKILQKQDDRYKVELVQTMPDDSRGSSVGHRDRNKQLNFTVYFHGSIDDVYALAHESAHALSSHHTHRVDMIRAGASEEELQKLPTQKNLDYDCVGEIESHIVEKLTVKMLKAQGMMSNKEVDDYIHSQQNSLVNNLLIVIEEGNVLKALTTNPNIKSVKALEKHYKTSPNKSLCGRLDQMENNPFVGQYRFRYIVAHVVSEVWMARYNASTNQEKRKMLKKFEEYLSKTHSLNITKAVDFLLDCSLWDCAQEYLEISKGETAHP